MKIKELIEKLSEFDPEFEVLMMNTTDEFGYETIEEIRLLEYLVVNPGREVGRNGKKLFEERKYLHPSEAVSAATLKFVVIE
jgi:hypothetical protein